MTRRSTGVANGDLATVTTTVANAVLVGIFSGFYEHPTFTPPAGMTERFDLATAFPASSIEVAVEHTDQTLGAAGATGTRVATGTVSVTSRIGALVALRPAGGGGGVPSAGIPDGWPNASSPSSIISPDGSSSSSSGSSSA